MLINLRRLRDEYGVTQRQLAEAIGVSQQSVNKYENHNVEPDIETMIRISNYFHTSVDYLVGNTEIQRKPEATTFFELNEAEQFLLTRFRLLPQRKQESILEIVELYNK